VYISFVTLHVWQAWMTFLVPVPKWEKKTQQFQYKIFSESIYVRPLAVLPSKGEKKMILIVLTLNIDLVVQLEVVVVRIRRSSMENSINPFQSCVKSNRKDWLFI
jgi:hypothetical protein